jgi:hypothetical protein
MSIGRNDACPCGSGKKYKKCCLGKAPQREAPNAVASGPEPVEPRFFSPVTSYYTQAALAEALKPGGTVHIHPYVIIKLRDDPRVIETTSARFRTRLLQAWRASKLSAMATTDIESRLNKVGAFYQRAQFIEFTKAGYSAWHIARHWQGSVPTLDADDAEFLGLAACELWRRFTPEHPSLEMIDDWICEGYGHLEQKKRFECLSAWSHAWQAIRQRLTPEIHTLEEAGERLFAQMSQCLSNWSQDFTLEALNGSLDNPRSGELGLRFIQEILAAFPKDDKAASLSGDLGTLLFNLRRGVEAEDHCQQLVRQYPDSAIGYVTLADGWLRDAGRGEADVEKIQRAVRLLEKALTRPVKDASDFDLSARLQDARELLSKRSG